MTQIREIIASISGCLGHIGDNDTPRLCISLVSSGVGISIEPLRVAINFSGRDGFPLEITPFSVCTVDNLVYAICNSVQDYPPDTARSIAIQRAAHLKEGLEKTLYKLADYMNLARIVSDELK